MLIVVYLEMNGCYEYDIAYNGHDMAPSVRKTRSNQQCQELCSESDLCSHWSWNSLDNTCQIRGNVIERQASAGVISGARHCSTFCHDYSPQKSVSELAREVCLMSLPRMADSLLCPRITREDGSGIMSKADCFQGTWCSSACLEVKQLFKETIVN